MYRATTRQIQVTVTPRFIEERSSPVQNAYFWAYTIEIVNLGSETVQLLTRHWRITDAFGRQQDVRGAGVVGEQPTLAPGERFEYTSGCPLSTPTGFMVGTYGMIDTSGQTFHVDIPAFSLDSPHQRQSIN
jgi:ApaG protein